RVLSAVRIALGALLLLDAARAARELAGGYFGDGFHWPIVPEALVPSRAVYAVLVGARFVLALLIIAGPRARGALLTSAALGSYLLLCDRLQYHNNRWALFAYSALLSFAPCDRALRLGRAPGPRRGPLWAARLAQLQVSIVYLASGGSKLLDPDWRGGLVLLERFRLYGAQAVAAGVPASVVAWMTQIDVTHALSVLAIATELFLAVGLWPRRTRVPALALGVGFHLVIEATSRVEGFTWLTLAMYALFLAPVGRAPEKAPAAHPMVP
ncbi:MAG: HTTM domain-containing protein, partial [Polyangiaceae bacterium]